MRHTSILLIGAGLQYSGGEDSIVTVDRESAAVCKRAAELFETSGATIYIPAGRSPKFGVMLNEAMAACLKAMRVPRYRIVTKPTASVFNTRGEAEMFVRQHDVVLQPGDLHEIFVVDRDFHMRRTCLLLEAQFSADELLQTLIVQEPVASAERGKNALREPLALAKDFPYIAMRYLKRRWRKKN